MKEVILKDGKHLVLFYGGPFSNFAWAPFVKLGLKFYTSEQCFMWSKAVFFQDQETAEKILKTTKPQEAKALGRQVMGYSDSSWAAVRYSVMLDAVLEKFKQNEDFKKKLKAYPPGTRFAEASPVDCIWGIGLGEDNPDAADPEKWRGTNLLGKIIEEVHKRL